VVVKGGFGLGRSGGRMVDLTDWVWLLGRLFEVVCVLGQGLGWNNLCLVVYFSSYNLAMDITRIKVVGA